MTTPRISSLTLAQLTSRLTYLHSILHDLDKEREILQDPLPSMVTRQAYIRDELNRIDNLHYNPDIWDPDTADSSSVVSLRAESNILGWEIRDTENELAIVERRIVECERERNSCKEVYQERIRRIPKWPMEEKRIEPGAAGEGADEDGAKRKK